MLAASLTLDLLLALSPTPDAAIAAALAPAGARAEVLAVRPSGGCAAEAFEARGAIETSGEVPLRTSGYDRTGAPCTGAAWASVRVFAPALVAARALRAGEPLEGAVVLAERELRAGRAPLTALPPGATAARPLRPRDPLAPGDVRVGPRPGEPVTVVARAGGLELERTGRAVPCARETGGAPRGCALLPGGRRVEGRLVAGRVLVEAP